MRKASVVTLIPKGLHVASVGTLKRVLERSQYPQGESFLTEAGVVFRNGGKEMFIPMHLVESVVLEPKDEKEIKKAVTPKEMK